MMAQLHDLIFLRRVRARPRLETLARFPPPIPPRRARANPPCPQRRRLNPAPAWCCPKLCPNVAPLAHVWRQLPTEVMWGRRMWRQNAASLAHVASGSQLASQDVVSKRDVREQGGVARCGVKMRRHMPTWRQRARWHRKMWRQNVVN